VCDLMKVFHDGYTRFNEYNHCIYVLWGAIAMGGRAISSQQRGPVDTIYFLFLDSSGEPIRPTFPPSLESHTSVKITRKKENQH
jgi:hypothetical protein